VFALSPLAVTALVLVAALLASALPRPAWLDRLAAWVGAASPLAWYGAGLVLGPVLHVVDDAVLTACMPALAAAIGWLAVRAGAEAARPLEPGDGWTPRLVVTATGALVLPAALLYAAGRWLPPGIAPAWQPLFPMIATLAATMALVAASDLRRLFPWVLIVAAVTLLWLFPHARRADLPRLGAWAVFAAGGIVLCGVLAARLRTDPTGPDPATIAVIVLGGGLGLATRTSPLLLCGVLGAVLARWSVRHRRVAEELSTSEPTVTALLWVAAGAMAGGPLPAVGAGAFVLALTPLLWTRVFGAVPRAHRGLALAVILSFTLTAARQLEADTAAAARTAAALALLITVAAGRLTTPTRAPEVSG
jgi:hypothetical protein